MSEMKKCTCPVHEKLESVVGAIHPPQEECACRKALENIVNVGENTHIRRHVRVASEALATPCPCVELREELEATKLRLHRKMGDNIPLRAELATARAGWREAVAGLRKIREKSKDLSTGMLSCSFIDKVADPLISRFDAARGGGK